MCELTPLLLVPSSPGLTRRSIIFEKKLDHRVTPLCGGPVMTTVLSLLGSLK
jgi:hypothetical protein